MDELIGFVSGNNNRQKILKLLGSKRGMSSTLIAKTARLSQHLIDDILNELVEKELIFETDGKYQLTELGITLKGRIQHI
ncbi:MAG: transcriptional regulator [Methanosarcinales archaeon]|nr:transcriptional regulator [Methanosarcinales archaeon]